MKLSVPWKHFFQEIKRKLCLKLDRIFVGLNDFRLDRMISSFILIESIFKKISIVQLKVVRIRYAKSWFRYKFLEASKQSDNVKSFLFYVSNIFRMHFNQMEHKLFIWHPFEVKKGIFTFTFSSSRMDIYFH